MSETLASETQREVWEVMQAINRAWLDGDMDGLESRLHEDMVIVPPGFGSAVEGREACMQGYRDFAAHSTVRTFREHDVHVHVAGETAVATYGYEITYEMDGESFRDEGQDLYVFLRREGTWLAVWRTLVPAVEVEAQSETA